MLPLTVAAFVAGACFLQTRADLPPLHLSALLLLPLVAYFILRRLSAATPFAQHVKQYACFAAVLILFLGGGFFNAAWRAEWRLQGGVPPAWQWKDITVEGTVRGLPDSDVRRTRFVLDIVRAVQPPMSLSVRAQLAVYHHGKIPPEIQDIQDGAILRARVRIRSPHENVNPGGFDYAGYLFARGILAAGYVRGGLTVIAAGGGVRESLRRQLQALPRQSGSLAALIIGDRSGISDRQWEVMRRTGTAHLLSISGTHITLAGGFAALLCGWLWRRRQALTRLLPAQQTALLAAVMVAAIYAWLAGFGVPVLRSLLMFVAAAVAFLCGGAMSALQAIAIAALLITAARSVGGFGPGFLVIVFVGGGGGLCSGTTNRQYRFAFVIFAVTGIVVGGAADFVVFWRSIVGIANSQCTGGTVYRHTHFTVGTCRCFIAGR